MKIWIDTDAYTVIIKEILFRAAQCTGIQLTLVANRPVRTPPRGELYTTENIKGRLNMQGFVGTLRSSGIRIQTRGGPPLNQDDRQDFPDQPDRWLGRIVKAG